VVASRKSGPSGSKGKSASSEKKAIAKPHSESEAGKVITIDRRANHNRRLSHDRRKQNIPVAVERRTTERRIKVNRRRQIDPTTCERDYSNEEIEFMSAMDAYKRRSGRMFPTCSEVLEVIKSLGYEKHIHHEECVLPPVNLGFEASQPQATV
jgi:hypothetical protein